jgi:lactate dehydrogenase-like 2-hydroxyacid dehydrogenase
VIRLCRWGRAEYERDELHAMDGVEMIDDPRAAEVVVVPSSRPVAAADVPSARLVITTTSGYAHLDLRWRRAGGVGAPRLPLARRDAVVHTTLAMVLSLTRRLRGLDAAAREGRWDRARLHEHGATLLGRVGVVGMGVIGTRMAEVLRGLGAEVVECRRGDALPLAVDVLTLHCSLGAANAGMVDRTVLNGLRSGAILVNTARGKLVDVEAAMQALDAGQLGGLGLDVYPREPAELRSMARENAILLPHAAGWHPRLGADLADGVAEAVGAYVGGRRVPFEV